MFSPVWKVIKMILFVVSAELVMVDLKGFENKDLNKYQVGVTIAPTSATSILPKLSNNTAGLNFLKNTDIRVCNTSQVSCDSCTTNKCGLKTPEFCLFSHDTAANGVKFWWGFCGNEKYTCGDIKKDVEDFLEENLLAKDTLTVQSASCAEAKKHVDIDKDLLLHFLQFFCSIIYKKCKTCAQNCGLRTDIGWCLMPGQFPGYGGSCGLSKEVCEMYNGISALKTFRFLGTVKACEFSHSRSIFQSSTLFYFLVPCGLHFLFATSTFG